jgi:hypothetical protein
MLGKNTLIFVFALVSVATLVPAVYAQNWQIGPNWQTGTNWTGPVPTATPIPTYPPHAQGNVNQNPTPTPQATTQPTPKPGKTIVQPLPSLLKALTGKNQSYAYIAIVIVAFALIAGAALAVEDKKSKQRQPYHATWRNATLHRRNQTV